MWPHRKLAGTTCIGCSRSGAPCMHRSHSARQSGCGRFVACVRGEVIPLQTARCYNHGSSLTKRSGLQEKDRSARGCGRSAWAGPRAKRGRGASGASNAAPTWRPRSQHTSLMFGGGSVGCLSCCEVGGWCRLCIKPDHERLLAGGQPGPQPSKS